MPDPIKAGDLVLISEDSAFLMLGNYSAKRPSTTCFKHFAVITATEWYQGRFFFVYYHTEQKKTFYEVWVPDIMERIG